eukprot:gene817-907_t
MMMQTSNSRTLDSLSRPNAEAKDLITKLLVVDPSRRLTAEEALNHAWIKVDAKDLEGRNLDTNLATLKKYAGTKKLKAAVRA